MATGGVCVELVSMQVFVLYDDKDHVQMNP